MISIKKDFDNIPPSLLAKETEDAFNENVKQGKHCRNGDNRYKQDDVKKDELKKIYHNKCGFCEKSLIDFTNTVEHYRPKSTYYCLAFSWDNLLLACEKCNQKKGNNFPILNEEKKCSCNHQTLQDAQSKIKAYDEKEKPLLLNPEQETDEALKAHFTFNLKTCEVVGRNDRMKETIELYDLNRDELVALRREVLNDLKNDLNEDEFAHKSDKRAMAEAIKLTFKKFLSKTNKEETEFISWRRFIYNEQRAVLENR